jgi:hypothetical protein
MKRSRDYNEEQQIQAYLAAHRDRLDMMTMIHRPEKIANAPGASLRPNFHGNTRIRRAINNQTRSK